MIPIKRVIKICFCVLTIALVLCSCVVPCFAANWGELTPNSEQYLNIPSNTPNWNSQESIDYLCDMVDKAYDIGLFGGGAPVAILAEVNASNVTIEVVAQPAFYPFGISTQSKRDTFSAVANGALNNKATNPNNGVTYGNTFCKFRLCTNGSYSNFNNTWVSSITLSNTTTGTKALAIWVNDHWETSTSSTNAYYSNIGATNAAIPAVYTAIMDKYESATEEGNGTTISYTLNIPAIISSVPNAAKLFINNSFGFDLFGINIAGLLSVLLVVAIVSFVVWWLMSR